LGHWYNKHGKANHFAGPNKTGTTLRQARKLNLNPSVTTIGDILAKPALINWLQEQAALEAAACVYETKAGPKIWSKEADPKLTWAKTIVAATRKKTMALADKGSDIHDIIERYYKAAFNDVAEFSPDEKKLGHMVYELIEEKTGIMWNNAITEKTFSHELGFGGKVDLHAYNTLSHSTSNGFR